MSSDSTFLTSDLRSNAQDYKRDATKKHKWALGGEEVWGRAEGKPRPVRPSTFKNRGTNSAIIGNTPRVTRKHGILDTTPNTDDSSSGSASDEYDGPMSPAADAGVMYSFDAAAGPSQGSQILTLALSKAVERFEERETAKLVNSEYDVLDSEGETVPAALTDKKRRLKHKAKPAAASASASAAAVAGSDADDDYEFV